MTEKEETMATEVAEETTTNEVDEATTATKTTEVAEDQELQQETDEVRIDSETDSYGESDDFDFPSWGSKETESQRHKKPTGLYPPKVSKPAKKDALLILAKATRKSRARLVLPCTLLGLPIIGCVAAAVALTPSILANTLTRFASILIGVTLVMIIFSLRPDEWDIFHRLTSLNSHQLEHLWNKTMDAADELAGATHREQVKDYISYLVLKAELASSAWQNFNPKD